jgi:hypothetical protein
MIVLVLGLPLIALVVIALLLVVVRVRAANRRRISGRYANGLCMKCGYDIRATINKCPECGEDLVDQGIRYWGGAERAPFRPLPRVDRK